MSSIESTVDHPVATDSDKPPTTPSNKRSSVSQQNLIYFEKQDGGALCATFALNNLLQGPFIDEIAMSNIGKYTHTHMYIRCIFAPPFADTKRASYI